MCLALCAALAPVLAQSPIANPGFEQGLDSWTTYSYQPSPEARAANPVVGCIGDSPCQFNLLHPQPTGDGTNVCGIQSYETTGNGGVCQSFTWSGGPASISVTARGYSERYDGTPFNDGCLVRMGLVSAATQNRSLVTSWVAFPWSDSWHTRTLAVPGSGTYTLFIEAYQPNSTAIMSTLWDDVEFTAQPPVLASAAPTVAAGPVNPDTSVIITWTTNVASSSTVNYGANSSYGQSAGDPTPVTSHSVTVSGLTHTSAYHFQVTSAASGYLDYVSDDVSFQTPIWFSGIVAEVNSTGGMVIDWLTDVPATSRVEYWSGSGSHMFTPEISTLTTTHEVSLGALAEGGQYSFRVLGRHQPGYSDASSGISTFWTLPPVSGELVNGSFENTVLGQGHSLSPWVQYATQEGESGYHPIDGLVGPYPAGGSGRWYGDAQAYDGSYFLGAAANLGYKNGGVFQRVSVNPGDFYTLTARYMTHRVGGEDGYTEVRVGVDPDGGVDPQSANIQWWSGFSFTNDEKWQSAAVTITAGESGTATVFLEFQQLFALEWHVAAIDGVTFGPPMPTSIGALKASKGSLGAILEDKIVTYASPVQVWAAGTMCYKVYIEDDNRMAGLAVLLPSGSHPAAGNKLSVTGALGVYGREAALLAASWTVDPSNNTLPKPMGMSQTSLGKSGQNQPALLPKSSGLCNVGLRVRVWGRVTYINPWDSSVYIDDGTNMQDSTMTTDVPPVPVRGIRTHTFDTETATPLVGDYIAVTGVLGVDFIDLDHWPDPTDYYIYSIFTNESADWDLLWSSIPSPSPAAVSRPKSKSN
jgi:hypothetical protein